MGWSVFSVQGIYGEAVKILELPSLRHAHDRSYRYLLGTYVP